MERYVVFSSNNQNFALGISKVERIIEFQDPKPIPEASEFFLGVIQYNDKILPIIDLTKRLYNVTTTRDANDKLIVVTWKNTQIGLVVDDILGIHAYEDHQLEGANDDTRIAKKYIVGYIKEEKDIKIVLDTSEIFTIEQEKELLSSVNEYGESLADEMA